MTGGVRGIVGDAAAGVDDVDGVVVGGAEPTAAHARPRRRRDPARKERILAAAADLVARHGYHAVSMAEIGAAAGIVGSGVYRHFPGKSALLVALLSRIMDQLQRAAAATVTEAGSDREAIEGLVANHVHFALKERRLLQVYHRESHNLPPEDLRRLRRAQRHYIEEWVVVLGPLRPGLSDAELRLTVHAAIGTTQSVLFHHNGLPHERIADMLQAMSLACLGLAAAETGTRRPPRVNPM